jgi:signal transduction histidine kinase
MIDQAFATRKSAPPFETNISTRSMGVRSLKMTVTYIGVNELLTSEQAHCIVTIDDMTEMKKKEHLVAALETIGAICHEMNQPLQAMMGNLELLAKFHLEAGAITKVEKINSEMERIRCIINKLLHVTDYQTKPYLSTTILDIEKSVSEKLRA